MRTNRERARPKATLQPSNRLKLRQRLCSRFSPCPRQPPRKRVPIHHRYLIGTPQRSQQTVNDSDLLGRRQTSLLDSQIHEGRKFPYLLLRNSDLALRYPLLSPGDNHRTRNPVSPVQPLTQQRQQRGRRIDSHLNPQMLQRCPHILEHRDKRLVGSRLWQFRLRRRRSLLFSLKQQNPLLTPSVNPRRLTAMHRAGTAANNETLTLLAGALGLARALLRQRMPILPLGHIQPTSCSQPAPAAWD